MITQDLFPDLSLIIIPYSSKRCNFEYQTIFVCSLPSTDTSEIKKETGCASFFTVFKKNRALLFTGLTVLRGAPIIEVLDNFETNLRQIFRKLLSVPAGEIPPSIYVNNLYEIKEIPPSLMGVPLFNARISKVANEFYPDVHLVDIFSEFQGNEGLLLIERQVRKGLLPTEVHPTIKGYRVIAEAFEKVIR